MVSWVRPGFPSLGRHMFGIKDARYRVYLGFDVFGRTWSASPWPAPGKPHNLPGETSKRFSHATQHHTTLHHTTCQEKYQTVSATPRPAIVSRQENTRIKEILGNNNLLTAWKAASTGPVPVAASVKSSPTDMSLRVTVAVAMALEPHATWQRV